MSSWLANTLACNQPAILSLCVSKHSSNDVPTSILIHVYSVIQTPFTANVPVNEWIFFATFPFQDTFHDSAQWRKPNNAYNKPNCPNSALLVMTVCNWPSIVRWIVLQRSGVTVTGPNLKELRTMCSQLITNLGNKIATQKKYSLVIWSYQYICLCEKI